MDPDQVLADVADRADLDEGPEGVRRLVAAIVRPPEGAGVRPIAREVGLPIPVAVAVVGELEAAGLVDRRGDGVALTGDGADLAEALGLSARTVDPYPMEVPDRFDEALARVTEVAKARGDADTTRDQAFATPETALRRALVLLGQDALEGRRVLFVGDGDLVSVACDAIGGADELVVVDSDTRLTDLLPDAVGFVEADLRDGLPDDLEARFDVAVTDPPFTLEGTELFLSRAIEALTPGVGRTVLLSQPRRDPDRTRAIQTILQRLGLAVEALVPGFNRYEGAHLLGGRGDLYRLATTSTTRPTVHGLVDADIYTGQQTPTRRTYRCVDCATEVPVGAGEDRSTIEALQAEGCPGCDGTRFELAGRETT